MKSRYERNMRIYDFISYTILKSWGFDIAVTTFYQFSWIFVLLFLPNTLISIFCPPWQISWICQFFVKKRVPYARALHTTKFILPIYLLNRYVSLVKSHRRLVWFILRPCQHDDCFIDGRLQFKVYTDEWTQVHSERSSLTVTHWKSDNSVNSETTLAAYPYKAYNIYKHLNYS